MWRIGKRREVLEGVESMDDFLRRPLREQLDELVRARVLGSPPADRPWLSQGMSEGLMERILAESSHRLERLTRWLVWLTVVLAILTAVLAYGEFQHLISNIGAGPG